MGILNKNSAMMCINTRNGIELIDLSSVVYLKADGNYTEFITTDGKSKTHLSSLAYFEEEITALYDRSGDVSPFFRLSRSYLVNTDYVQSVNLCTQMLGFFPDAVKPLVLSKRLLKSLQTVVYDKYQKPCGK
ncbi:MAG: LytTR family transcriptional regulator DNA-binding domain-containing protein [Prevotella sp.]|nr:LytTR family transcriptional regulator DNA-binding domain-containing protein [Prevotella sp.]